MTDRNCELVPDNRSLVRERTLTTGLCSEGCYSEHSGVCWRAQLVGRSVKVKKFRKVDGELPCEGRLKDIDWAWLTFIWTLEPDRNHRASHQKSAAAGKEYKCEEVVKGRWNIAMWGTIKGDWLDLTHIYLNAGTRPKSSCIPPVNAALVRSKACLAVSIRGEAYSSARNPLYHFSPLTSLDQHANLPTVKLYFLSRRNNEDKSSKKTKAAE